MNQTSTFTPLQNPDASGQPEQRFMDPNASMPALPPSSMNEIDPGFSVDPPVYPNRPVPEIPCLLCSSDQWLYGAVRFLNATVGYNPLSIQIDNQTIYRGLNDEDTTRYSRISPGYHFITVMADNGYVYLQKNIYLGDGMSTVAIINAPAGLDLTTIPDTACPANSYSACIRVCNLAYYSNAVNVSVGNIIFHSVSFTQVTGFSRLSVGSYTVSVARSDRPGEALLTTSVNLNPNRIYTLYVLNWNTSPDTIRTLLVEDRRN